MDVTVFSRQRAFYGPLLRYRIKMHLCFKTVKGDESVYVTLCIGCLFYGRCGGDVANFENMSFGSYKSLRLISNNKRKTNASLL